MTNKTAKHEIDMTTGKLFPKIFAFAVPLILTSILQLLFNSADMVVVGQFVNNDAVGAVGSTGSLNALIVNLAIGFAGGAGVALASAYGAHDKEYGDKVLHTSMLLSVILGFVIGVIGFFVARPLLTLMGTPDEQLNYAADYLEIIFAGSPFNLVYNFGASMMRATGDTKRPLIFLSISGVINIIVNIITVVVFGMGVVGVALATIMSQAISAVLVVTALVKNKGFVKLSFKKLGIDKRALKEILRLGVPTVIQSALFSISNVMLQSAVNSFGSEVVNGSSVSGQIEGYVYAIVNSISTTALTVVGQNYGAHDYPRIKRTVNISIAFVVVAALTSGWLAVLCHEPLCRLFINSKDPEATERIIGYATERMIIVCGTYFLDGIMEVVTFSLRGIGYSVTSMLIVLAGTCVYRIIWIFAVFPLNKELWFLFILYPISWIITSAVGWIYLGVRMKKDGANAVRAQTEEAVIAE